MASEARPNPWATFLWGAIILTVGVIFWLDRLGRLDARDWLEWWPVVFFVIGLSHLLQRRWIGAGVWTSIGAYLLLLKLGYEVPSLWWFLALWPLLLSVAGLTLIVQTLRSRGTASRFRAFAVMAGNHVRIGSQEFGGGQALAVMGGCEIDLDSVRNAAGEATIDVLAFWGGIDIRVPRGWQVVDRVTPILGGFEDKTSAAIPGAPRLVVRGASIMGGVEVSHRRERGTTRPSGGAG
jgi:hypothetical protein